MSIIHDALKKVQKNMEHKTPSSIPSEIQEKPLTAFSVSAPSKKNYGPLWMILPLSVLVLGTILFMLRPQHTLPSVAVPPSVAPIAVAQPLPPAVAPLETVAPPAAPTPPEDASSASVLTVQGIMKNDNQPVALINNAIYEEGNVVEGRTIIKIDLNSVTVEYKGKQEILKLKK